MDADGIDLQSEQSQRPACFVTREGVHVLFGISLAEAIEAVERAFIARALTDCGHNVSEAALLLGISRRTFYNKLYAYKLARRQRMRRRWVMRRWPARR